MEANGTAKSVRLQKTDTNNMLTLVYSTVQRRKSNIRTENLFSHSPIILVEYIFDESRRRAEHVAERNKNERT